MMTNKEKFEQFERELAAREQFSEKEVFAIYNSLHKYALDLGLLTDENIWEGFEGTLRIARAINDFKQD